MLNLNELTNKNPDELINIIQSLQETLLKNKKQLQNKDILIACLNDTIALMKHEKFASRSEKYIDNSLQGGDYADRVMGKIKYGCKLLLKSGEIQFGSKED